MKRIVTYVHHYKDPSRKKRKAAPLEARPVIVTATNKPQRHDLDTTPEGLGRRVDAAAALFREVVRRTTARAKQK